MSSINLQADDSQQKLRHHLLTAQAAAAVLCDAEDVCYPFRFGLIGPLNAIAPFGFRAIEGRVGVCELRVKRLIGLLTHRDATAHRSIDLTASI